MMRVLAALVVVLALVFGWHLVAARDVRTRAEEMSGKKSTEAKVSVDRVSNLVTVTLSGAEPKEGEGDAKDALAALGRAIGSALGGALAAALEPTMERELNLKARERYDVYAILLPYRVKVEAPGHER